MTIEKITSEQFNEKLESFNDSNNELFFLKGKKINFINNDHKKRFEELLVKSKVDVRDHYRINMFYILSSHENLFNLIPKIYDFNYNQLKIDYENQEMFVKSLYLSNSMVTMLRLAINSYNSAWFKKYDYFNNFYSLSYEFRHVLIESLKIRYLVSVL
jgi:hypothetical protein